MMMMMVIHHVTSSDPYCVLQQEELTAPSQAAAWKPVNRANIDVCVYLCVLVLVRGGAMHCGPPECKMLFGPCHRGEEGLLSAPDRQWLCV